MERHMKSTEKFKIWVHISAATSFGLDLKYPHIFPLKCNEDQISIFKRQLKKIINLGTIKNIFFNMSYLHQNATGQLWLNFENKEKP